jgi:hypothetical protein
MSVFKLCINDETDKGAEPKSNHDFELVEWGTKLRSIVLSLGIFTPSSLARHSVSKTWHWLLEPQVVNDFSSCRKRIFLLLLLIGFHSSTSQIDAWK